MSQRPRQIAVLVSNMLASQTDAAAPASHLEVINDHADAVHNFGMLALSQRIRLHLVLCLWDVSSEGMVLAVCIRIRSFKANSAAPMTGVLRLAAPETHLETSRPNAHGALSKSLRLPLTLS